MGGTAGVIVSLFLALMVIGILQLVSVLTVSKVSSNIDQSSFTAAENTTVATLKTNTLDSFELGGTAQIVLAAATIIAAVFGLIFFARGR